MLKTSQWVLHFLETRQRSMHIFYFSWTRLIERGLSAYYPIFNLAIYCVIRIQCGWLQIIFFIFLISFRFFLSLSLSDCVGVFVAFLGRYSVSVTTKQTPFGSPSFSHISPLYGYTDLCTHACLQLFKMKPMHSEPLSLSSSSSSISRTNIEAGGRVYKRHGGKRKIIYKDTRNTYHQTAQTWATMPTRRQSEADQKRIFTHRRLTNTNTHTHSPRNTHTDAQEDEGRRQMEESV
jgi:hypothetical protein